MVVYNYLGEFLSLLIFVYIPTFFISIFFGRKIFTRTNNLNKSRIFSILVSIGFSILLLFLLAFLSLPFNNPLWVIFHQWLIYLKRFLILPIVFILLFKQAYLSKESLKVYSISFIVFLALEFSFHFISYSFLS